MTEGRQADAYRERIVRAALLSQKKKTYQSRKLLIQPVHKGKHLLHVGVGAGVDFLDEILNELCFCFDVRFDLSDWKEN